MGQMRNIDCKKFLVFFILVWAVQMAAAFYFCTQKQGFHEDEYYTYYSTSRTNGFYVESGQWMERDAYRNEFVVLPNERFRYGLVKLVQSWDVHPPVYYWVFHTVASLVPDVFSKWIGFSVNLFFHGINIILLTYMSYLTVGRCDQASLFAIFFWGLSPAVISGVVFIRMYEMLTTFVLLCAVLHIGAVMKNEEKLPCLRCLAPMAAVTYLGFLTQYYYFIFLFYLAIAFCAWLLWRDRNIHNCIRYGVSQGAAFLLAYATYPSCLGQMFRGQRGAQATGNFFDWSNTAERIVFFYDLMNRYVFGHMLTVLLLLIIVFAAAVYRWDRGTVKKRAARTEGVDYRQTAPQYEAAFWMLAFTAAGYFLTVAKTALLYGGTSNRYQLPIYGIVVFLIFTTISRLWQALTASCTENSKYAKYVKYTRAAAVLVCLTAILLGHWKDGVEFLYPEDREQTAFAEECAAQGTPAVYLYQPGEEWCVWDVTDELLMYPKVYFAAVNDFDLSDDTEIKYADSLVVYIAGDTDNEQIMRITTDINVEQGTRMFDEKYCSVWYFE